MLSEICLLLGSSVVGPELQRKKKNIYMYNKILAETKLIFGYRRPPNLKDMLVRARVPQIKQDRKLDPCAKFANRCNNKKCKLCLLLQRTGRITSTETGWEYEAKKNVTWKSSNLIYCITCKRCRKQYRTNWQYPTWKVRGTFWSNRQRQTVRGCWKTLQHWWTWRIERHANHRAGLHLCAPENRLQCHSETPNRI